MAVSVLLECFMEEAGGSVDMELHDEDTHDMRIRTIYGVLVTLVMSITHSFSVDIHPSEKKYW